MPCVWVTNKLLLGAADLNTNDTDTSKTSPFEPPDIPEANDAAVVIIRGEPFGKSIAVSGKPIAFGRSSSCDIQFAEDSVSRRHCQIWHSEKGYRVQDLGSTNGTRLNDQKITNANLEDGDLIGIGDIVLKFVAHALEANYHEELYSRATRDPLTGIANRRLFEDHLQREIEMASRYAQPLSLAILDIDRFKTINDRFDHVVGDGVLVAVTELLKNHAERLDTVARLGGEEFAIIMPNCDSKEAFKRADKLRKAIAAEPICCHEEAIDVTASVGVAEWSPRQANAIDLVREADQALMLAKSEGRNTVRPSR